MSDDVSLLCALVGAACALVGGLFAPLRHGVTVVHELGHTLVALLAGRSVRSIRLRRDSSGEAVSAGRARGPGVAATLLAGYPAPGLAGLAGLLAVMHGRTRVWLVGAAAALALVMVLLRTAFGVLVIALVAGALVVIVRWASAPVADVVVATTSWFLLVGGLRSALAMLRTRGDEDDGLLLARATGVPAPVWRLVLLAACLGCAVVAVLLMRKAPTSLVGTGGA